MLPFLVKHKQNAGISMEIRKPDQEKQSADPAMEACAKDIMDAISASDMKRLAQALRAAFEIMELEPHQEGPHTNEE